MSLGPFLLRCTFAWVIYKTTEMLVVLEAQSPSSRQQQTRCPLRAHLSQMESSVVLTWQKKEAKAPSGLFIRALNPFMKAPPSCPSYLLKTPPLHIIALGIRFKCMNFGGMQTFRSDPFDLRAKTGSGICMLFLEHIQ